MSRLDDLLRCRPHPPGPCQADMGRGVGCGEPGVATVRIPGQDIDVCAEHVDATRDVAATVWRVLGGGAL